MVFNNDCQYYSTLHNSVDMLSFRSDQNSIHNNKKQHVNYQI